MKRNDISVHFTAESSPAECVAIAVRPGEITVTPIFKGEEGDVLLVDGIGARNPPYPPFSKGGDSVSAYLPTLEKGEHKYSPPLKKGGRGDFSSAWLVLVGLGKAEQQSVAKLRRIGGAIFTELVRRGPTSLTLKLGLSPVESAELAYGFLLRSWQPANIYRQNADPEKKIILTNLVIETTSPAAATKHFEHLEQLAEAVAFARDLVVAPGNYLTPESFGARNPPHPHFAKGDRGDFLSHLEDLGINIEIIDPAKAGLRLLAAVGRGSYVPPCLILLHWQGASSDEKPAVFVGKGITFDTGGISLKPSENMEEMKGDMAGAAAIAGLLKALAARRAPFNAIGVLAIAENMIASRATRPGDIVYGYNNLSVEIIDTDAEGRLILADALAYAADKLNPAFIIDLATLTGAVEIALGHHRAGLFANNDRLAAELMEAGDAEEEKLWPLPLSDLYDDALESDIADLKNCQWKRGPDAIHAARFLEHFVPAGIPWAHIDIAGTSESEEDGPTGFGVRLLNHFMAARFGCHGGKKSPLPPFFKGGDSVSVSSPPLKKGHPYLSPPLKKGGRGDFAGVKN